MKTNFVTQAKEEMKDFVVKAIDDLLAVLNTPIEYPVNGRGQVLENKLYPV